MNRLIKVLDKFIEFIETPEFFVEAEVEEVKEGVAYCYKQEELGELLRTLKRALEEYRDDESFVD